MDQAEAWPECGIECPYCGHVMSGICDGDIIDGIFWCESDECGEAFLVEFPA